jgi:SH3-like domain-containing protein
MNRGSKYDGWKSTSDAAETMSAVQKELLETYEEATSAWMDRVKSEIELWSKLQSKILASRTPPEALQAFQECWTERLRMAAEDGQKLGENTQKFVQNVGRITSQGSGK